MNRVLKYAGLCLGTAVVLLGLAGVLYAYHLSNPRVEVPVVNREKFANVVVFLDGTRSMSNVSFGYGKRIVLKGIVPYVGIGDKLACYSIGPEFGLSNIISGGTYEDQPPHLGEKQRGEVLELLRKARSSNAPGRVRTRLYRLIQELKPRWEELHAVQSRWARQIEGMGRPEGPGSNLTCAVEAIDAYFRAGSHPDEEKMLFIVSDLIQERRDPGKCRVGIADSKAFQGVRIVLLYPHDSRHDWRAIIGFWRQYFGERRIEVYPFSAVLNQEYVLKPNPTSGLEQCEVRTFGENFSRLVHSGAPLLLVALIAAAAVSGVLVQTTRRKATSGLESPSQ